MKETNRKVVTAFLMAGIFLSALEATIVATAMPTIVGKLGGFTQFTWVFSLFLLTQAASTPIYGKLADLYGRKPMFAVGASLFILGSGLCGFAHSMTQLIIFRAIQGLGAGSVLPIAMVIVGDLYPGQERAKVQGLLSGVWATAAVIGPAVGGIIIQAFGWPWIFGVNVPLGVITLAGVTLSLHERVERHDHKIDYPGAIIMVSAISMLLFALLQAGTRWTWVSPQTVGFITLSLALFALFIWVEERAEEPLLPLSVMRKPLVSVVNICAIITGGLTVGASSFLPTYAQGVLGTNAIIAGATIVTLSVGWPIASTLSGRLIWRYGYRRIEVAGMLFCVMASILYLGITPYANPLYIALCSFVMGIGLGLASTTQLVSVQSCVDWKQRGIATSSVMFSRIVGSTLLVALLGTVVNTMFIKILADSPLIKQFHLSDSVSVVNLLLDPTRRAALSQDNLSVLAEALGNSIHATFWLILISSVVGAVIALRMPGGIPDKHGQLDTATEDDQLSLAH